MPPPPRFRFLPLVCLVVGNMIGAGVYVTSGYLLADLGSPGAVVAAWATGAVVALLGAWSYGMLVRRLTDSGGEYLFLSRHLHPCAGYIAGWVSLLAGFGGAVAFAALTFAEYAARVVALPPGAIATLVVVAAGLTHGPAPRAGTGLQTAVVLAKLVGLVVFAVALVAAVVAGGGGADPSAGITGDGAAAGFSAAGFLTALMWVSLSYSGYNAAIYVAGESAGPRVVAAAMVSGTAVVAVLYLVLNAIFVFGAPAEAIAGHEDVAHRAAEAIGGAPMALAADGIVAVSLLTSVWAMVMAGPRVYAKMADDGFLPAVFRIGAGGATAPVLLQVVVAVVVIWVADLRDLLSYLGFTLSVSAALTVATLLVRRPPEARTAELAVPILFVAATLTIAGTGAVHQPAQALAGLATVAVGVGAYLLHRQVLDPQPRRHVADDGPPPEG